MTGKDNPPENTGPCVLSAGRPGAGLGQARRYKWPQQRTVDRVFMLTLLGCSFLIALLATMEYRQDRETALEIALATARDTYARDLVYRRWATMHGGVYVPATPETPPNPHLSHIPERDLVTPSGRELTLVNPAYMTRQVHELGAAQYGLRAHITSLKPLRPENAPDAWEGEALQAFERGEKEKWSLDSMGGEPYLRLMRPLITEQGCLKCHGGLGYAVGDVRGGISVSVPWEPFRLTLVDQLRSILFRFGFLWLIGISALWLARYGLHKALSELVETGEALIESEERFRKLFQGHSAVMLLIDPDTGKIVNANEAAAKFYGWSIVELTQMRIQQINMLPAEAVKSEMEEAASKRRTVFEFHHRRADGSIRDVEVSSSGIKMAEKVLFYSIIHDITDRKQAEAALRKSEADEREREVLLKEAEERRILLDNIPTRIWYLVDEQTFGAVNEAHAFSYGKRKEDLAFRNLYDVLPREVAEVCRRGNSHVFNTREPVRTEEWVPDVSGEKRLLFITKTPKLRADGSVEYVVCSGEDITERRLAEDAIKENRRLLEEALVRANELATKAEAASVAKSRFLANMSHEIRTPLNAVIGFSQLMQGAPELSAEQRKHLEIINRNGEHLLGLLNDILELSKIEAGRASMSPASFDLHALLGSLAMVFEQRARARNVSLVAEGLDHVPQYLVADEQKLRQVLFNLLGNAVKFTETGEIRLRAGTEPADREGGGRLVILVEDTGPGIGAEDMGLLFDAFEQTGSGRRTGQGTGLGLAISQRFARMMGGDLTAASEVGKGSVFRLDIPVRQGTDAMAAGKGDFPAVRRIETGRPPCRILIVEDTEDSRALLAQLLCNAGFEVRVAVNGAEAVETFSAWRPHLIVMDHRMPGMNGDEAIRRIRSRPGGGETKIIALTADATSSSMESSMAAGADDFLTKPFRSGDLFEKIRFLTGVRYLYAEEVEQSPEPVRPEGLATNPPPALTREMMEDLPAELRKQLYNAVVRSRQDYSLTLIEQVTPVDPAMGGRLRELVERFEYETLIELLS